MSAPRVVTAAAVVVSAGVLSASVMLLAPAADASTPGSLGAGGRLVSGATLTSPAGKYRLVMQTDGNLVERRVSGNAAVWTSNTAAHAGAGLIVQTDGNVVVYPKTGRALWNTGTRGAGNSLILQDDGNLVVRSSSGRALWASGADRPSPPVAAGDVLRAGQTWTNQHPGYYSGSREFMLFLAGGMANVQQEVAAGGTSTWSAGKLIGDVLTPTTLTMQRDGNLVLTAAGRVQWSTNTAGTGTANYFVIQDDGNLVVRNSAGKAVWASTSGPAILPPGRTLPSGGHLRDQNNVTLPFADLAMQPDGNLVMRYGAGVVWASNTHVAGSRLVMQTDGNAVIVAPTGAAVWSTDTAGHPGSVLLLGGVRDLQVTGDRTWWEAP